MKMATAKAAGLLGVKAVVVEAEVNIGSGLPGIHIVGLADAAINESRERIKAAIRSSNLDWPGSKIVINLTPASLPKGGSGFDLAMAVGILQAEMQSPAMERALEKTMLLGELALDGRLREVTGIVPAIAAARAAGLSRVIIPEGNEAEAAIAQGIEVICAGTLAEVYNFLLGAIELPLVAEAILQPPKNLGCYSDIVGQRAAKWAAEVAAAGGHHMMLIGPPGSGKSMIASRLPSILPPLSPQQALEATSIYSVAGQVSGGPIFNPPLVAPHSSLTTAALIGGGNGNPRPGAISLAHHGVLFLDEASEIPARVLDALRQPMEEGHVRLIRHRRDVFLPAQFQLVLAANPCRCGADQVDHCRCTGGERRKYLSNVSGPLKDRLDIVVDVPVETRIRSNEPEEESFTIQKRVMAARERARARWHSCGFSVDTNAAMDSQVLRRRFPADAVGMTLLETLVAQGDISQRGVDKILKIAWTIADLEAVAGKSGADQPTIDHVARAVDLRSDPRFTHSDNEAA